MSRRHILVGFLFICLSAAAGGVVGVALFGFPDIRSGATSDTEMALDLNFENAQGETVSLADFRGKAILLNVWATWCAPCRVEMPSLDRLQTAMGSSQFEVVPLSIDRTGLDAVRPFFAEIGIEKLDIYLDKPAAIMGSAGILGLPTTILIDDKGRELQRWVGPKEWDDAEAVAEIRGFLENGSALQPSSSMTSE